MKKLILSAAIVLGSFTAIAQETPVTEAETTTETVTTETTQDQEVLTAVASEEIPMPVTDALEKAFPGATISKAEMNEEKEYKLQVKAGDKEGLLYFDANGKWIKK